MDLAIALVLAAALLPLLWPYRQPGFESLRGTVGTQSDEGIVLYTADRVRRGAALYRETWDFKGPIGYVPLAIGLGIGEPGLAAGRSAMLCLIALWSAATYLAVRRMAAPRWAALVFALLPPFVFWPAWPYAYPDFSGQLWITLAAACALSTSWHSAASTAAGACAALAFWTSLPQGLPTFISLGAAFALAEFATDEGHPVRSRALGYLRGALAVTLIVLLWFSAHRSLGEALHGIFVFPFESYMTPYNQTRYGFDRVDYVDHWTARGVWHGRAVDLITSGIVFLPIAALSLSLSIAGVLAYWAGFRLLTGRPAPSAPSRTRVMQWAVPAALSAAFVPVVLGETRSDICHIGFVGGTSTLVLALGLARVWHAPRSHRVWRWVERGTRLAVGAGFALLAGTALVFHVQLMQRPSQAIDIDGWIRARFGGHTIAARTRPDDRIVVLPAGGYAYLGARRDAGIPFTMLWHDRYCEKQWPVAARHIVETKPPILLVSEQDLNMLGTHQPSVREMYFGYSGNYMLKARRPGPPLCLDGTWTYRPAGAQRAGVLALREHHGTGANFIATLDGAALQAHVDENRVAWFDGNDVYAAALTRDGRLMKGRHYRNGYPGSHFTVELLSCEREAK